MDEKLILEETERFLKGEMSAEEMQAFRELRLSRPDIDQMAAEYSHFLTSLDSFVDTYAFRKELRTIENELKEKGIISGTAPEAKPSRIFSARYRGAITVAASVAGIIALLSIIIISSINSGSEQKIKPLVEKIKQQEKKTRQIENKVNQLAGSSSVAPMETRFRATGFLIDPSNGYLITNAHVVKEAKNRLMVEDKEGNELNARAVYYNPQTDLAILKITDEKFIKLPPVPFNIKKNKAELGEAIFLLGYPKQEIVYDEGYISAMNGYDMDTLFYQLSTPANEGNSGSPILNRRGELLGVISSMQTNAQGVVFAIKSPNILEALDAAKKLEGSEDIQYNSRNILRGLDRTMQVRKLQDYIFMIKGD